MARTPGSASAAVLAAAEELFYGRGIAAVGVDLLAERAGVTKRTLYNRFGSKDALVAAYLDERGRRWREQVSTAVAAAEATGDAVGAVVAPFEALRAWGRQGGRGCAFLNALAELPDPAHPGHAVAVAEKRWQRATFVELATAAGCADPEALAARLAVLHDGVLARQPIDPDALAVGTATARALVAAAVGTSPSSRP